jgi:hypothetical protein
VIEFRIPVAAIVFTVLDVAALPDLIPAMSSYRRREIVVPDWFPWTPEAWGAEPAAVPENEKHTAVLDDVIVPAMGYGKTIVVKKDEIRASVDRDNRPASEVDMQIEFSEGVGSRSAEQHSRNTGCQKEDFFHR